MWSIVPESVATPYLVIWTVQLSRVDLNPESQNWPRDRRGCCRDGKKSHLWEDRGIWGKGSRTVCISTMVLPFGMRTNFPPYMTGSLSLHGKVSVRKWVVQP